MKRRLPVERGPPTRDVRADLQVQCVLHHLIMPCLLPHIHDNEDQGKSEVNVDRPLEMVKTKKIILATKTPSLSSS